MRSDDRSLKILGLLLTTLAACTPTRPPAPAPTPAPPAPSGLPDPAPVRSQAELRKQAAQRLIAANPGRTYLSQPPEPLLAVPVLQIELHVDGSIKRIEVMREPRQAKDTIQLAKDALHRAAPFGNVSRMPPPWTFTETFLFDDQRRFKPRSLD